MYGNEYPNHFEENRQNEQSPSQSSDYGTQPRGVYSGYQTQGGMPGEPEHKKKGGAKKVFARLAVAGALGLCFGLFAGAGFYAVDMAADFAGIKEADSVFSAGIQAQGTEEKSDSNVIATSNSATAVTSDVTGVVENVMPSVVSVTNRYTQTSNFFGQTLESEAEGGGSGIIVGENDTELLVVSNYHVVADADELSVQFIDGEQVKAQVKGYDSEKDLAVLAVSLDEIKDSTRGSISIATLGDSDTLVVGEPAIAIGNALGYGQSVTTGVISAVNREIVFEDGKHTLIQTDAAINPGNSGGALLNISGEVIGINSNKIGGTVIEGMGYAIPISSAKPIIEELMNKVTRDKVAEGEESFLGISGVNVTEDVSQMYDMPKGVYVAQVYEGTGAEEAGLAKGDIITRFDGSSVSSMEELQDMLQYYPAGTTVEITVQQGSPAGYQEKKLTVTLGARADAEKETE